jgi:hypothetical protein
MSFDIVAPQSAAPEELDSGVLIRRQSFAPILQEIFLAFPCPSM